MATEAPTFLISPFYGTYHVRYYLRTVVLTNIIYHQINCNKKLTILTIPLRIILEQLFDIVDYRIKEDRSMSQKEIELIDMICNDRNPVEALTIAIETIIDFLEQPGSSQELDPACFREPA